MNHNPSAFYTNDVLLEDFDFTVVEENERTVRTGDSPSNFSARARNAIASLMTGAMLVFGPLGFSEPSPTVQNSEFSRIVVQVQNPGEVLAVPLPVEHLVASARFKKLFVAAPLNEVESLDEPDYGF